EVERDTPVQSAENRGQDTALPTVSPTTVDALLTDFFTATGVPMNMIYGRRVLNALLWDGSTLADITAAVENIQHNEGRAENGAPIHSAAFLTSHVRRVTEHRRAEETHRERQRVAEQRQAKKWHEEEEDNRAAHAAGLQGSMLTAMVTTERQKTLLGDYGERLAA